MDTFWIALLHFLIFTLFSKTKTITKKNIPPPKKRREKKTEKLAVKNQQEQKQ